VVDYIGRHRGHVHFETAVTAIEREGDRVTRVHTSRGPFSARTVISNIDPATTMAMIAGATVPQYEQSGSCFTVFLGLDIDLGKHGFRPLQHLHYPDTDLDAALDRTMRGHFYEDPFFFLSTPSLYADPGVLAPPGCTTVQINVASSFDYFDAAMRHGTTPAKRSVLLPRFCALSNGG